MIRSFGNKATENAYNGDPAKSIPAEMLETAHRKLDMIHAAHTLNDLRIPPGNRLEKLKGEYSGYHSIRINRQYRVVFKWTSNAAEEVEIVDYH